MLFTFIFLICLYFFLNKIKVIEGDGIMMVVVVGPSSTQGKIDEILKT